MVIKNPKKLFVLGRREEDIVKAMRFYRYMTAMDVCHLLYSPSVLTWVRSVLAQLAGGEDFVGNQYLYRFRLADARQVNQKVYTLGSRLPASLHLVNRGKRCRICYKLLSTRQNEEVDTWMTQPCDI